MAGMDEEGGLSGREVKVGGVVGGIEWLSQAPCFCLLASECRSCRRQRGRLFPSPSITPPSPHRGLSQGLGICVAGPLAEPLGWRRELKMREAGSLVEPSTGARVVGQGQVTGEAQALPRCYWAVLSCSARREPLKPTTNDGGASPVGRGPPCPSSLRRIRAGRPTWVPPGRSPATPFSPVRCRCEIADCQKTRGCPSPLVPYFPRSSLEKSHQMAAFFLPERGASFTRATTTTPDNPFERTSFSESCVVLTSLAQGRPP